MLNHVMLGTNEIDRAQRFYDSVLGVLWAGKPVHNVRGSRHVCLFYRHDGSAFCLTRPISSELATVASGATIGFNCQSTEQVRQFNDVSVAHWAVSIEDPPGERQDAIGPLYLAYVRDPNGQKLCAMHRPG